MNEIARKPTHSKASGAGIALADALRTLRAHRAALEAMGVVHVGVFGSVARGEAGADSDVDILVDLDDERVRSIYDYCGARLTIGDLFGGRADVVARHSLRPRLKGRILSEVVDAF